MPVSTRLVCLISLTATLYAESAVLECTADTWVSTARDESMYPQGGSRDLQLRGSERMVLLNFRFAAIDGWRVRKATLLLHHGSGPWPARIGVSTVSAPWSEMEATYRAPHAGAMWTELGGDIRSVIFSRGNSRCGFFPARPYRQELGWIEIPIDPGLIAWLLAGRGCGLVLLGLSPEEYRFNSRETPASAPYLLIEGLQP